MNQKYNIISIVLLFLYGCGSEPQTKVKQIPKKPKVKIEVPTFNADSAYHYIQKQVDFGPRVISSKPWENCAFWLEQKFLLYTPDVIIQEATTTTYDGKKHILKNIIASFSTDKKNRVALFAHWDSRHIADHDTENQDSPILGANDGGSGVGVLLEVARNISEASPFIGVDIIFFDVEDQGQSGEQAVDDPYSSYFSWCLGSQYWSQNPHTSNYQARFGILLDMVGGPNAVFIPDYGSDYYASEIVDKVWKNAIENGYMDYFDTNSNENYISLEDYELLDDHIMINQFTQMLGRHIPTIDIIEFDNTNGHTFNQHWHTHQDNMDNIDKETLEAVGQTVLNVIYNE